MVGTPTHCYVTQAASAGNGVITNGGAEWEEPPQAESNSQMDIDIEVEKFITTSDGEQETESEPPQASSEPDTTAEFETTTM